MLKTLLLSATFATSTSILGLGLAHAQEPVKIGFISTFSGPEGALGRELQDGFKIGLQHTGNKIGGRPVEVIYGDDQTKPDIGRGLAEKMLESDHVQIVTGINFSNVLLAVAKPVLDAGAFYISVNAGPSQYAGKLCNPHFFSASFQNDTLYSSIGTYMQQQGIANVVTLAPNYPAGRDMMTGFRLTYKGDVLNQSFTTFGQLDYAVNIAEIREKNPKAVLVFYPGGMGINFAKQYAQAGLMQTTPLFAGAGVFDQTSLPAIGDAAIGIETSTEWSEYIDDPVSKRFAADFEKANNRIPSSYAATAYDAERLMDAAATSIQGKIEDKPAFQKALETVKFDTVRPGFHFNTNHYPIQTFYLVRIEKDEKGRLVAALKGTIMKDIKDAYAQECSMK
jgi:branched-chain amino acid transport system substrate-binding protein